MALSKNYSSSLRLFRLAGHLTSPATSSRSVTSHCKQVNVYDATMSYIDTEEHKDRAVIFLHGNPTSSFLWRNVIPHIQDVARCLAPDLIGMGKSSKLQGSTYTYQDHFKYLSKWMDAVNLPAKVNLVVHDWGSGLGFHWANLNRDRVMSLTHMESMVGPMKSWDHFPEVARHIFQAFRSDAGEDMVLQKNMFVERLLPMSIMRKLEEEEMNTYLAPYLTPGEDRRPTLTWPREIPVESDGPDNVVKFSRDWNAWLSQSSHLPKLYINADPGFFSNVIKEETKNWPNHRVITVKGLHFLQEDSPDEIGRGIREFLLKDVFV